MNKQEREEFNMAVVNAYDEILQKKENRGVSYGELAYIESLSDKEAEEFLEECYKELEEELQDKVRKNYITNIDKLTEYEPTIDVFNDVLSPIEWNFCDLCGALYPSDEMCWTDYLDIEEDKELIEALKLRGEDVCAICWECVKELKK